MLQYFIRTIFNLNDDENNIIYYELINNKNIRDILSKKDTHISSSDYDKCIDLINQINNIINV